MNFNSVTICCPSTDESTNQELDAKLLGGAALFGVGWGLSGYCPGPAIASMGGLTLPLLALLAAMVLGWFIAQRIAR